jgi:cell division protein FtsB
MANETLIAYQNQLKQNNLSNIASYEQTIVSVNQAIAQMNANIDAYNAQKTDLTAQISLIEDGNVLIDQTIAILEQ